jgi:DNA-binding response OmpR family regulator
MHEPSILIVDDDAGTLEILIAMLRSRGYRVTGAAAADLAYREIEREVPDAILLDLHLGKEDGLEFLRTLRSVERHASIPVALITGNYLVDECIVARLQGLGARLYFKPLWEEDVLEIAAKLLRDEMSVSVEPLPAFSRLDDDSVEAGLERLEASLATLMTAADPVGGEALDALDQNLSRCEVLDPLTFED